ncbi:lipopolysaccharide biosynthesis protein [Syntrophus aciditrophicus]|nr:hypothetical protein [Syntrophus aciditrophicus]
MSYLAARSQVSINLGFTLIKSVFLLLSIWLADFMLSSGTMGLMLLLRRQVTFWGNLLQLGFSQSLQKFYPSNPDKDSRSRLWWVFVKWVVALSAALFLISAIYGPQFSSFLFSASDQALAWSFALYVSGMAFGFLACSAWLVEFKLVQSNMVDWLNGSLIFVLCILIGNKLSNTSFALCLSSLTLLVSMISLIAFGRRFVNKNVSINNNWSIDRPVFFYGLTRGLTAFADMGTMTIGPWLLKGSPVQAGHLIIAYTVLRIAQTLIMPVAQVLALRANSYQHDRVKEERRIFLLGLLSFAGGWVAVAAYYAVGEFLITLWLPHSFSKVVSILDELMIFTPAVCLFYSLRNHIELRYMLPCNLIVLVLALIGLLYGYAICEYRDIRAVVYGSKIMFSTLMLSGIIFCLTYLLNSRRKT